MIFLQAMPVKSDPIPIVHQLKVIQIHPKLYFEPKPIDPDYCNDVWHPMKCWVRTI